MKKRISFPGLSGLRRLRRVMVQEAEPLLSVLMLFIMVMLVSSIIVYLAERKVQPELFGSLLSSMLWVVVTLTTTGYGNAVPVTPFGQFIASLVMICGLGVFGIWTGILATAFANETRREQFLRTWDTVTKVPFFTGLSSSTIADVTHVLRTIDLPAHMTIIHKGQHGDCMYFIASGEVEVDLPGKKDRVLLREGDFFGEMALLGNNMRNADVTTTRVSKLLILDIADFHLLMSRHPDLANTIDAEAKRRASESITAEEMCLA
jgi:voltage-gated potassium channel